MEENATTIEENSTEIVESIEEEVSEIIEETVVETEEEFVVEDPPFIDIGPVVLPTDEDIEESEEETEEEETTEEETETTTEDVTGEEPIGDSEECDTYFGHRVYYNSAGYPYYIDEDGNRVYITDTENILKAGESASDEETTDIEEVETYTEVPFLEKPLDKYTTTEGLLLLILILLCVAYIWHVMKD